jgi:hypothetical protein
LQFSDGWLCVTVTDEILLGKFAESGGNVNEFVRGLRSSLTV